MTTTASGAMTYQSIIPATIKACVSWSASCTGSADVFGAIPSLHVAYPLQAVYFSFKFGSVRKFSIFFYIIMCFSAVYLNHHYVLDVLLGSLYAIVVTCVTDYIFERRRLRAAQDSKAFAS